MKFYKTKNDTYIFNPSQIGYGFSYLMINDIHKIDIGSNGNVEIKEKPVKLVACTVSNKITHYVNKDGEKMPAEEYALKIAQLQKYCNSDGNFENLDREYDYRKFCIIWSQCIHEQHIQYQDVEIFILNLSYSAYPEIKPMHQYGSSIDDPTCSMCINPQKALYDICKEMDDVFVYYDHEEKDLRPEIGKAMAAGKKVVYLSQHQNSIRFSKLNNDYLPFDHFDNMYTYSGTYSDCLAKRQEYSQKIKDILTDFIYKKEVKLLTQVERTSIISRINDAINSLQSVEPHRKHYKEFEKAKAILRKVILDLTTVKPK